MAETLKEYQVGDLTYQLNDEDAKALGDKAKPVSRTASKGRRAPANKAVTPEADKAAADKAVASDLV